MVPARSELAAEVYDVLPVQPESLDRRPSGRSQAEDPKVVVAPREVLIPSILARMEQRRILAGDRIDRVYACVLVVVAALTGESEIVPDGAASSDSRNDVFDGEG
jgi:hypothetical protein